MVVQKSLRGFVVLVVGFIASGCTQAPSVMQAPPQTRPAAGGQLAILSWNIRGYPEKQAAHTAWVHTQLDRFAPDVVCLQEIANQADVTSFSSSDTRLKHFVFKESSDGMDNAIFADDAVTLQDLPDPQGFQHPAQAARVMCGGFDAVVVTVHLSWTNLAMRESEKALLRTVVQDMARIDPDVIVAGDFNLKEQDVEQLAQTMGMVVMVPAGQNGVGTTQAGNRYDHFIISHDLADEEAIRCHIQTFTGSDQAISKKVSDHLPVEAWFKTDDRFRDRPL